MAINFIRGIVISLALVISAFLAGCAHEAEPSGAVLDETAEVNDDLIKSEFFDLFVGEADLFLAQFDAYVCFYVSNPRGLRRLVLVPNVDMRNFRYIAVGYLPQYHLPFGEWENDQLFESSTLFEIDLLEAGTPFAFHWAFWQLFYGPARVISFVDSYGSTRYMGIGKDDPREGPYPGFWIEEILMAIHPGMDELLESAGIRDRLAPAQLEEALRISLEYMEPIQSEFFDMFTPFVPLFVARESFVDVASDVTALFLSRFDSYAYFYEYDLEDIGRMVFIANTDMRDFRFIETDHLPIHLPGDEWEGNHLFKVDTLFELDLLKEGTPFVFQWRWRGHEPTRVISFVDSYGNTRYIAFGDDPRGDPYPGFWIREIIERTVHPGKEELLKLKENL